MILNETDLKIKEDIDIIFSGGYDNDFSEKEINRIKELSFIYNHTEIKDSSFIFKYNSITITIGGSFKGIIGDYKNYINIIITELKSYDEFKNEYQSFCKTYNRDKMINKLLD